MNIKIPSPFDGANFQAKVVAGAIIGGLIILLIAFLMIMSQIGSCRKAKEEKKDANNKIAIERDKGHIDEIKEQQNAALENNNLAANISEQANQNLNAVLGHDVNRRDGNYQNVRSKFCAEHPGSCR